MPKPPLSYPADLSLFERHSRQYRRHDPAGRAAGVSLGDAWRLSGSSFARPGDSAVLIERSELMVEAPRHPITADDAGGGGLQVMVGAGAARFVADQPVADGGLGLGPTPHDLVSAALAACMTQTLRLYARHKAWPLGAVHVEVRNAIDPTASPPEGFQAAITLQGPLSPEQRARLLEVANRCPVHRLLDVGARVSTDLAPAA
jgi:putative redox protein